MKGTSSQSEGFIVKDLIDRYLNQCRVSPTTLSELGYWEGVIGYRPFSLITPQLIKQLRADRLKGASVATCNRELAVLKRVFNVAVSDLGLISSNPIAGISQLPGAVRRDRWITIEEEERLVSHSPIWLGLLIVVALNTGMRRSEMLNLRWEHVFIDHGYLVINKSKNGGKRNIPINSAVLSVLRIGGTGKEGAVFSGVTHRSLHNAFCKAKRCAGIEDLHWHDLRHTFCTRLLQNGCDLYRAQVLMGHSSFDMVKRYAHHSVGSLRGVVDGLVGTTVLGTTVGKEAVVSAPIPTYGV